MQRFARCDTALFRSVGLIGRPLQQVFGSRRARSISLTPSGPDPIRAGVRASLVDLWERPRLSAVGARWPLPTMPITVHPFTGTAPGAVNGCAAGAIRGGGSQPPQRQYPPRSPHNHALPRGAFLGSPADALCRRFLGRAPPAVDSSQQNAYLRNTCPERKGPNVSKLRSRALPDERWREYRG